MKASRLFLPLVVFYTMLTTSLIAQINQRFNSNNTRQIPFSYNTRIEQTPQGVKYKIYLKEQTMRNVWKGIVLFAGGNNEFDPVEGPLNGGLENKLADALSKAGYIAAIVAYRDQPPLTSNWSNFSSNADMMATDLSNVANTILGKYKNQNVSYVVGGTPNLSRSRVIVCGFSYGSFALLTDIAYYNTLADIKGLLAPCGSTGVDQASKFKIPIYSLGCTTNYEGDLNGKALIDAITNPTIKQNSSYFSDPNCNLHCGGNLDTWTNLLLAQVKKWLP